MEVVVGRTRRRGDETKLVYQLCPSYNDRLSFFGTYHTCERSQLKLVKHVPNRGVVCVWESLWEWKICFELFFFYGMWETLRRLG